MNRVLKYSSLRTTVRSLPYLVEQSSRGISTSQPSPSCFRFLRNQRHHSRFEVYPYQPLINWGITIVGEQRAYLIERSGKYTKTLTPGLHYLNPFLDDIAHVISLKEGIPIPDQHAITKDNVTIYIDWTLYVKVVDPYFVAYKVQDPVDLVIELAQETMCREVGKMTLDETRLNLLPLGEKIVEGVNARIPGSVMKSTDAAISLVYSLSPEGTPNLFFAGRN